LSSRLPALLAPLAALVAACGAEGPPPVSSIPDGTVVLTFDDAHRSHLETVAPILEEMDFGATFFVTALYMRRRPREYLTWEQVAGLHRRGFEIGDHTWRHGGYHVAASAPHLANEIATIATFLEDVGVPRPTSFAWPGGAFGPESRRVLIEAGYRFGRRGMGPEATVGTAEAGPACDPTRHDPLLVPTGGCAHRDWTMARFDEIVSRARGGRAVVLQFHGVPDAANPELSLAPGEFRRYRERLEENGCRGVALRDLARWVDPVPLPSDPLTERSFERLR